MIKCPKCNEDNQLGAIFCRHCGDKLDLDDLRPDDIGGGNKDDSKLKLATVILRNLLILLIIIGVIGAIVGAFIRPAIIEPAQLTPEEEGAVAIQFKKFRKGKPDSSHEFTTMQTNTLAKMILKLTEKDRLQAKEKRIESGEVPPLYPDDIAIEFYPPANMKVMVKYMVYDKLPLHVMVVGTPTASETGANFTPSKYFVGRVPIPIPPLHPHLNKLILDLVGTNDNFQKEVKAPIRAVAVDGDKVVLRK